MIGGTIAARLGGSSMRARRIGLAVVLLLGLVVIVGGLACGSKTTRPVLTGGPTGDPPPFGDGDWELSYTLTATAGDPSCAGANGSFVDTFTVAAGDVEGLLGTNCVYVVGGTHFSQTCRDTYTYSLTCRFVITISGSGDVNGDTFTATYTVTVGTIGDCSMFNVTPCTFTISATGTRLPTIAQGVRVRDLPHGIERLVTGRALAPTRRAGEPR
jgi:hypothetical protein